MARPAVDALEAACYVCGHTLVRWVHRSCWYGVAHGRVAVSPRSAADAALHLLLRLPVFGGCAKLCIVSHDSVRACVLLAQQTNAPTARCPAHRIARKRFSTCFCCGARPCLDSGDGMVPHSEGGAGS